MYVFLIDHSTTALTIFPHYSKTTCPTIDGNWKISHILFDTNFIYHLYNIIFIYKNIISLLPPKLPSVGQLASRLLEATVSGLGAGTTSDAAAGVLPRSEKNIHNTKNAKSNRNDEKMKRMETAATGECCNKINTTGLRREILSQCFPVRVQGSTSRPRCNPLGNRSWCIPESQRFEILDLWHLETCLIQWTKMLQIYK